MVWHVATAMDFCVGGSAASPLGTFTIPIPSPSGTLSGNCLILGIQFKSTGSITSVKDSAGNSFTAGPTYTNATDSITAASYYLPNCASGSTYVIITFSGLSTGTVFAQPHGVLSEWYNVASSPTVNSGTSSTTKTAGSFTPAANGALVWSWGIALSTNINGTGPNWNGTSITASTSPVYTLISADLQVGSCEQYYIQPTATAITPAFTTSGAATWGTLAMSLTSAAAGTSPSAGIRIVGVQHMCLNGNNPAGAVAINNLQFPSTGNLLAIAYQSFTGVMTAVTDSASNTWVVKTRSTINVTWGGGTAQFAYAANATSSSTLHTIAMTFTGTAGYDQIAIYDITGAATSPFDTITTTWQGQQTTNGNLTSGTITPSTANGLILATIVVDFNTVSGTSGVFGSDVVCNSLTDNNSTANGTGPSTLEEDGGFGHCYNSAASSQSCTWTSTTFASTGGTAGLDFWVGQAIAFKAAAITTPPTVASNPKFLFP